MFCGKEIREKREGKGLSREALAKLTDMSKSTIQRIENGENVGIYYITKVVEQLEREEKNEK